MSDGTLAKSHIESTPGTCGGKPRISGTRIRVQDIVVYTENFGLTPDEILHQFPHLTLAGIHAALSYYYDHMLEIKRQMEEGEAMAEAMRRNSNSRLSEMLMDSNAGKVSP